MSGSRVSGLDGFSRKLNELKKKIDSIGGEIPLDELLSPDFMQRFTNFASCAEMLKESNYSIESKEDFRAIPDEDWDMFISKSTQFSTWHDMLHTAAQERVKQQLQA